MTDLSGTTPLFSTLLRTTPIRTGKGATEWRNVAPVGHTFVQSYFDVFFFFVICHKEPEQLNFKIIITNKAKCFPLSELKSLQAATSTIVNLIRVHFCGTRWRSHVDKFPSFLSNWLVWLDLQRKEFSCKEDESFEKTTFNVKS